MYLIARTYQWSMKVNHVEGVPESGAPNSRSTKLFNLKSSTVNLVDQHADQMLCVVQLCAPRSCAVAGEGLLCHKLWQEVRSSGGLGPRRDRRLLVYHRHRWQLLLRKSSTQLWCANLFVVHTGPCRLCGAPPLGDNQ